MRWLVVAAMAAPSHFPDQLHRELAEQMLPALREYWLGTGLLEEGEWLLKSKWSVDYDLNILRKRQEDTPDDAPPLCAQHQLPDWESCWQAVNYANRFLKYLDMLSEFATDEELGDIADLRWDTERRIAVWNQCSECRNTSNWGRESRRHRMAKLRDLIGQDDFDAGRMPHPLPDAAQNGHWRFVEDERYEE